MPRGAWVIYDEHGEVSPNNIARGTGRTPGQIAPALHAMARRNGVRARGVIDSAAEARTAGRMEASIADLFREAGVRVTPARKGARVPRFELLKQLMANGEALPRARAATAEEDSPVGLCGVGEQRAFKPLAVESFNLADARMLGK